jgi:hypothetical protein
MLQEAFGDNATSQSKTSVWYKRFNDGRTFVEDDERSGRPSTSITPENIANVREASLAYRRRTIHNVCEVVGLPYGTVQRMLGANLNMRRISAKFVPRLLSDDRKAHRVSVWFGSWHYLWRLPVAFGGFLQQFLKIETKFGADSLLLKLRHISCKKSPDH